MLYAAILTHNEEKNISHLIESLSFCDGIFVIDHESSDKTVELARKAGAKVIQQESKSFADRRNSVLKHIKEGDWLHYVDADEEITIKLQKEIIAVLESPKYFAYAIPRQDIFWGHALKYGEVWRARHKGIVRLVQKGSGKWKGEVHEVFEAKGAVGKLLNPIIHRSHDGIADFLYSVNNFSTLRASEIYKSGYRSHAAKILIVPPLKFIYTYFLLGGILDGPAGFVYSFMMTFHSFLVRSKVYLLQTER